MEEHQVVYVEKPDDAVWDVVGWGIDKYNAQKAGEGNSKGLCCVLYSPTREVLGGLIGETHWGWFYISLLFLKEEWRGRGYGSRLLDAAEEEARKRGATHAYLDTFSFQAPEFYKRHGYEVFGELKDFPPGHQRYYMVKHF